MESVGAAMVQVQAFNDDIVQRSVHRRRDEFIARLRSREAEILKLAATKCGKPNAEFFQSQAHGSYLARGNYNVSFFIELSGGQRCVLRIPLRPCLAYCPRRKLECEIATMRHMSNHTTVPVPRVLAECLDGGPDALSSFVIVEYIDGKILSPAAFYELSSYERSAFYQSLADFYIQLRRQEFSSIGRLKMGVDGAYIGEKTATLVMNMMQLEGLDPWSIQDSHHNESGSLKSANTYTKMLLHFTYNAFLKSRNAVGEGMGLEYLYNHFLFTKRAQKWLNPDLDRGPFVLVHGDLSLSNLLLDRNMNIVGVLDWEWSRVVPVQYFMPPLWFTHRDEAQLAHPDSWTLYNKKHFSEFLTIVKSRENELHGSSLLHDEWAKNMEDINPLIANALENWTEIDWLVHQNIFAKDSSGLQDDLAVFAAEDPLRGMLAEVKEQDFRRYKRELEMLEADSCKTQERVTKKSWRHWTEDWATWLQKAPSGPTIVTFTIAASVVIAAVWSRARLRAA